VNPTSPGLPKVHFANNLLMDSRNHLFFMLGDYHIIETDRCRFLQARGDVGIGIKGHLYAGVA
jgi:hypothetical protein